MSDKSPKAVNKKVTQKEVVKSKADQNKQRAAAAKQSANKK
jgi:hypothetical protein